MITLDGARKYWIDYLMRNGTLKNLASLKSEGAELSIRIIDHDPKTDPGLACIESGYGPEITGIYMNYFGSSNKESIPDGLTIAERIKAYNSSWKTALVMPWTQGAVNVTNNVDSTFWNQRGETDYWFSSENLTWSVNDPVLRRNALSFPSALLRANFTALKVSEFIRANYARRFYARVHFVEPDTIGHSSLESTDGMITREYMRALVESDEAVGTILKSLKEYGIYDDTIVMVTTDHGFFHGGHNEPPYPFGNEEVTVGWLVSNSLLINNTLGWGIQDDIAPTVLELGGIDISELKPYYQQTLRALPLWMVNAQNRELTPPSILRVVSSTEVYAGEMFNVSLVASDTSGILSVLLLYNMPGLGWRERRLAQVNATSYVGSVGPFAGNSTVEWYVKVYDNSTSRNLAIYPENGRPMRLLVKVQKALDAYASIRDILIILALGAVGVGVVVYMVQLRRKTD